MEQARHPTGAANRRAAAGRMALAIARVALRAAPVTLPLLALRALFRPREQPLSGLSDRQFADVGLTRGDVARPQRPGPAELEIQRLLWGQTWRWRDGAICPPRVPSTPFAAGPLG